MNASYPAHGGCGLINRTVPEIERKIMLSELQNAKSYHISDADCSIFYRIADGGLSPLEGPMEANDFNQALEKEYIEKNGKNYAWTIPIAFPISKKDAYKLRVGEIVAVKNSMNEIIGSLEITDICGFDRHL